MSTYQIKNKTTGELIAITDEKQIRFLISELEEESIDDKDYWLHISQLDDFEKSGMDLELLSKIRQAFGDSGEELEIQWTNS
jgi:hypothetical protein